MFFTSKKIYRSPGLWFYGFRFVQFLASSAVAGVMFYFIHHLQDKSVTIPWMFFFLQGAALLTLVWLAISTTLHFFHKLSPLLNAIVNGFSAVVWIVAFAFLANRMRWVIVRQCTIAWWANEKGVLICRLYKLLFSAAVVGVAATIAAFCTDVSAIRRRDDRGKYVRAAEGKDLRKGLDAETEYLRPEGPDAPYSGDDRMPRFARRSPSPAASSRGASPVGVYRDRSRDASRERSVPRSLGTQSLEAPAIKP